MLTLERMGIRTPSIYAAGAQQAERLTALDRTRGRTALAQFQGASPCSRGSSASARSTARRRNARRAISFALRLPTAATTAPSPRGWTTGCGPALPARRGRARSTTLLLAAAAGPDRRCRQRRSSGRDSPTASISAAPSCSVSGACARAGGDEVRTVLGHRRGWPAVSRRTARRSDDVRRRRGEVDGGGRRTGGGRAGLRRRERDRALREAVQTLEAIKRPADLSDARKSRPRR